MIPSNANFNAANAALAKQPVHLFSISGYSRVFESVKTGTPGQYPWILSIDPHGHKISEREGNSTLQDLSITIIDKDNALTADLASTVMVGRTATLKTGFVGLSGSDYVQLFTGRVDTVNSSEDNTAYTFTCKSDDRLLQRVVYRTGDDGVHPTDKDNPKTVSGHPLDILLDVLQNELGYSSGQINLARINFYKTGLLAGAKMRFSLTTAPEAKQWLDLEIFKALGGFSFVNSQGQFTPVFLPASEAASSALTLNDHNLAEVPVPETADLLNFLTYRLDYDGDDFLNEMTELDATSVNKYGLHAEQVIESRGMRSIYQAIPYARLLLKHLAKLFGDQNVVLNVNAFWNAVLLEPGDYVSVTHPLIPDAKAGVMGITNRLHLVLDRLWHFDSCIVEMRLLDVGWLGALPIYQVAPDGTPNWTAANPAQKATYMFVDSASTGKYSDGTPGHPIY